MNKMVVCVAALLAGLAQAAPALKDGRISGEVLETQDAAPYVYLRLKTAEGEIWAAVNQAPLKKGQRVDIEHASLMQGFQSKTLNRRFDQIVFGELVDPKAAGAAPHAGPTMAAAAREMDAAAPVPKAPGADGRTVAEVVKGRASLVDKPVAVRGRIVKVNNGIMGKNWWHLRDGSGSAADGSNDILVTTMDSAAAGDIVLVKGKVKTDVKLGAGYDYAVMIDATAAGK